VSDEFDELADMISNMAAMVKCSPEKYRDGLTTIIERLETDRTASEESNP
jgi:hypothetical protein